MDERKDSLKRNILYNTVYQILTMLIPLISAPYIARLFEADGVGIVGYTSSIAAYFVLLAALGTAGYGQWMIAKYRDDPMERSHLFWEIEIFCVLSTVISLGLWAITILLLGQKYHVYYLILSLKIVAVAFDITWFFAGLEKFRFIVFRNTAVRLIGLILLFTVITEKEHIARYVLMTSMAELIGSVSMWSYLPGIIQKPAWKHLNVKRHIKSNLVFFVPTIATSIYNLADKTMLGAITGEVRENGYYEQANKIIGLAKAVLYAFTGALSPRMSYLYAKENNTEFTVLLKKSLRVVILLAVPMCFGIVAVAPSFVPLFFGKGYEEVIGLLRIASFLIILIGISNCLERQYYTPVGLKGLSNRFVAIGAALNVLANYLLIPGWKSIGAETATLLTECTITVLYLVFVRKILSIWALFIDNWRYIAAGIIMLAGVSFLVYLWPVSWWSLLASVGIGVVLYFGVLLLFRDSFVIVAFGGIKRKINIKK